MMTTNATLSAKLREYNEYIKPIILTNSKRQTTRQRTRVKVTVCLYFNPSNSARSLSTQMTVAIVRVNPPKVKFRVLIVI